MVSHPEVNRRLREFVCVRMDWDQMERHKARLQTEQGNQVLLDPQGNPVPGTTARGKRYAIEELIPLLDRTLRRFPPETRKDRLELSWFFWNPKNQGYPGNFNAEAISKLDRKPVLTVSGPVPALLREEAFLRKHLRQFIWTRGDTSGAARVTVRQVEPEPKTLAALMLTDGSARQVSRELDQAWREYMKVRPLVARGYIDNPHGRWLQPVMEKAHREELSLREKARKGTLLPPGRE